MTVVTTVLGVTASCGWFATVLAQVASQTATSPRTPKGAFQRILRIGPGEKYQRPGDAQDVILSGDKIVIAPGVYRDCLEISKQITNLTIEGTDVTIQDRTCAEKGLFVIGGGNVVIRGITFKGAKVNDRNGAGIRAEGKFLTVENCRFIGNEDGILATAPGGTLIVRNSIFEGNGTCIRECAHGIYASGLERLRVEASRFGGQHEGHHIKARASQIEIVNNDIYDGPTGNSSYLIDMPNGGKILIANNRLEKGPNSSNPSTAIAIGAERGLFPTPDIRIENNSFTNDQTRGTLFVKNFTQTPVVMRGNKTSGRVVVLNGPGEVNGVKQE